MTRTRQNTEGRRAKDCGSKDAGRIIIVDGKRVLYDCERKRHAMAFLLGFKRPAAIYKRIATVTDVARELCMYWPVDEEFPVIQTESM